MLLFDTLQVLIRHYGLIDWVDFRHLSEEEIEKEAQTALSQYIEQETNGRVTLEWGWGWVYLVKEGYEKMTVTFPVNPKAWDAAIYLLDESF